MAYYYTKLNTERQVMSVFVEPFKHDFNDSSIFSISEQQYKQIKSRLLKSKIIFDVNERLIDIIDLDNIKQLLLNELESLFQEKIQQGFLFNGYHIPGNTITQQKITCISLLQEGEIRDIHGQSITLNQQLTYELIKTWDKHLTEWFTKMFQCQQKIQHILHYEEGKKILEEFKN